MTTAELIAALQAADPAGTAKVMCNGDPVTYCVPKEAYYDGSTHSIEGDVYRIARTGVGKVVLYTEGIEEWLYEYPDGVVEFVGFSPEQEAAERKYIEIRREEARKAKQ